MVSDSALSQSNTEISLTNHDNRKSEQDIETDIPDVASSERRGMRLKRIENSSETSSQSEGDTSSSGGREIQSIIGGKLLGRGKNHEKHRHG